MERYRLVRYLGLLGFAASLQSCASGNAPLPKQASVERLPKPASETDYVAAVQNVDVIYFPTERAASAGHSEPAALLLDALEKTHRPFAIGWDMIYASQQPLLDRVATATGSTREQLLAQLEISGGGRAREHCRAVLREARAQGVQYLALRCPAELVRKISASEKLTAAEEALVARGYNVPSEAFDSYVSQRGGSLGNPHLDHSYRAELVRLQFAAEGIVHYLRKAGGDKLVVFATAGDLESDYGLPYLVAQKANARQLVLGSGNVSKRPRLLTQARPDYGAGSPKS